jgi:hypothetical protein
MLNISRVIIVNSGILAQCFRSLIYLNLDRLKGNGGGER